MIKPIVQKCGLVFVALAIAAPAFAAERIITVTGTYAKEFFFFNSFGSADAQLPVAMEIVVEDSDPNILVVPAGFLVGPLGQPIAEDVTLIPASAITSLSAAIGNGSWGAEDLQTLFLFANQDSYAVAITGSLGSDGTGQEISLRLLDFNVGELLVGENRCDATICFYSDGGLAKDFLSASEGLVSNVSINIESAQATGSDYTYTYQGNPFEVVDGDAFTTSDFVSGSVTLSQPLEEGCQYDVSYETFSFSAGPVVLTAPLTPSDTILFDFCVSNGVITDWNVFIADFGNTGALIASINDQSGVIAEGPLTADQSRTGLLGGPLTLAFVADNPGTWSFLPPTVDELIANLAELIVELNLDALVTHLITLRLETAGRLLNDSVEFNDRGAVRYIGRICGDVRVWRRIEALTDEQADQIAEAANEIISLLDPNADPRICRI